MNSNLDIQNWGDIPKSKLSLLKKKQPISKKLEVARQKFSTSKMISILDKIYRKNIYLLKNNLPLQKHDNLINVVSHPDLLRVAFRKLSKNKGAMTPGSQNVTADNFSEQVIKEISQQLLTGTFKWQPVRQILIPKPGRTEKRPLGLPDFDQKVVQEAIRMVLESIYEPSFAHYDCNSGFRPKKDCAHAIRNIRKKAQFADYCIEGDIVGAFPNVNHDVCLSILQERISCKKFLKLLYTGFKAGIMQDWVFYDQFLGVPQGGISSPILFNIYMHKFDEFVIEKLLPELEQSSSTNSVEITSEYSKLKSQAYRARAKVGNINPNTNRLPNFPTLVEIIKLAPHEFQNIPWVQELGKVESEISQNTEQDANKYAKYRAQFRRKATPEQVNRIYELQQSYFSDKLAITKSIMRQTPYLDISRKAQTFYYHRYADDWVLFLRGDKATAEKLKASIAEFLKTVLKLELSPQKTKITHLETDKARYLGFEIFFPQNELIRKSKNGNRGGTQRIRAIQISPDLNRLVSRFQLRGYLQIEPKTGIYIPREIGWLTVLTNHEIVEKYNQFMLGLGNYYITEISQPSYLGRWLYLLYYSCLKTLATKNKLTVKGVIQKYGFTDLSLPNKPDKHKVAATDLRICIKYTFDGEDKWITLINYKEMMFRLLSYKKRYEDATKGNKAFTTPTIDFMYMHKTNFRTQFKYTSACSTCGSQEPLQNHHINPIKHKGGKFIGYRGFDKLVASLGRKQLPVCKSCHENIHKGVYNGMALQDLYDVRIATCEGLITAPRIYNRHHNQHVMPAMSPSEAANSAPSPKDKYNIVIDEYNRTYIHYGYQRYLQLK